MKRITVEMVKEAYAKTGLMPHRGDYFFQYDEGRCACGIGALTVAAGYPFGNGEAAGKFEEGFELRYVSGFTNGFDGERANLFNRDDETYMQGHEDGRAAWEAVKP